MLCLFVEHAREGRLSQLLDIIFAQHLLASEHWTIGDGMALAAVCRALKRRVYFSKLHLPTLSDGGAQCLGTLLRLAGVSVEAECTTDAGRIHLVLQGTISHAGLHNCYALLNSWRAGHSTCLAITLATKVLWFWRKR